MIESNAANIQLTSRPLRRQFVQAIVIGAIPIVLLLAILAALAFERAYQAALDGYRLAAQTRQAGLTQLVAGMRGHVTVLQQALKNNLESGAGPSKPVGPFGLESGTDPGPIRGMLFIDNRESLQLGDLSVLAAAEQLFPLQRAFLAAQPAIQWSYVFAADESFVSVYPWAPLMGDDDNLPRAAQTLKSYFRYDIFRMATPAANPRRHAFWTPAYIDAGGAGLVVSHGAPVDVKGRFTAMIGADVRLSVIGEYVRSFGPSTAQFYLVDQNRTVLAASTAPTNGVSVLRTIDKLIGPLPEVIKAAGFFRSGNFEVLALSIPGTPWSLVEAVPYAVVSTAAFTAVLPYFALALGILVSLGVLYGVLTLRFIRPAAQIADYVEHLQASPDAAVPRVPASWQHWLGRVRHAARTQSDLRMRAERQQQQIHQIEKLAALGSLLAGVAHEINNPLAILVAQATLLREKADNPDIERRAERIHAAAHRAGRIVKSFLAMARQNAPSHQLTQLNELVEASLEMIGYGLRSSGIDVVKDLDPGLPVISLDRDLIAQVITNLVINAQQALTGGPPGHRVIRLSTKCVDDRVILEISDSGPGVPADIIDRIFDPYFTTKPAGAGTGIGLSISKDIVTAHRGGMHIENRREGGAIFRVTLPATLGTETARVDDAGRTNRRLAILIIDDEIDVAKSLAEILERDGHETRVVESVEHAREQLADNPFDVIFVDLRMPGVDGLAFLDSMTRDNPALASRIVLMTGDTIEGTGKIRAHAAGRTRVILEKPFTVEEVRAVVVQVSDV